MSKPKERICIIQRFDGAGYTGSTSGKAQDWTFDTGRMFGYSRAVARAKVHVFEHFFKDCRVVPMPVSRETETETETEN